MSVGILFFNLLAVPFAPGLAQAVAPASVNAAALVRRAVQQRLDADKDPRTIRYLLRKIDQRRDTTKEIIQTKDGDVARLVAIDGKPLSAEADQAELDRLNNLAAHPELQAHRHKREQKDTEFVDRLMNLLPEAFLYRLVGSVPCDGGQCYRLSFTPNPNFVPPDMEARFLRGIAGDVWIDRVHERMTQLDAHLISNVDFGFGILAKLNKGGTVQLEQANVGENDWEVTGLKVSVTGTALIVRSLDFQIKEEASHFSPLPANLTYKEAIQLLKNSQGSGIAQEK